MDAIAKLYEFLNKQYEVGFSNLLATSGKDLEGQTTLNFKGYDGTILTLVVSETEISIPPVILEPAVAASATLGDNVFTAMEAGLIGNSIALIFDGILSVQAVADAHNLAMPDNMVSFTGDGATIPLAATVTLSGGLDAVIEEPVADEEAPIE